MSKSQAKKLQKTITDYHRNDGPKSIAEILQFAKLMYQQRTQDCMQQARKAYALGAIKGNIECMRALAQMLEDGFGGAKKHDTAQVWRDKAGCAEGIRRKPRGL